MSLARVVTFTGVSSDRIEELKREMDEGEQPEGLNPSEMFVLHDADSSEAVAILFFDSDEDYQRGHEVLEAMPVPETPGQRNRSSATTSRFEGAGSGGGGTKSVRNEGASPGALVVSSRFAGGS